MEESQLIVGEKNFMIFNMLHVGFNLIETQFILITLD